MLALIYSINISHFTMIIVVVVIITIIIISSQEDTTGAALHLLTGEDKSRRDFLKGNPSQGLILKAADGMIIHWE